MKIKCTICKQPFIKIKHNQVTCGYKCRKKRSLETEKQRHINNRKDGNMKKYNLCAL